MGFGVFYFFVFIWYRFNIFVFLVFVVVEFFEDLVRSDEFGYVVFVIGEVNFVSNDGIELVFDDFLYV